MTDSFTKEDLFHVYPKGLFEKTCDPGWSRFRLHGKYLNRLERPRVLQDDATYQISRLKAFWCQTAFCYVFSIKDYVKLEITRAEQLGVRAII